MDYHVDQKGFYGEFGGAYIPEMFYPNVRELEESYLKIIQSDTFQMNLHALVEGLCRKTHTPFQGRASVGALRDTVSI